MCAPLTSLEVCVVLMKEVVFMKCHLVRDFLRSRAEVELIVRALLLHLTDCLLSPSVVFRFCSVRFCFNSCFRLLSRVTFERVTERTFGS